MRKYGNLCDFGRIAIMLALVSGSFLEAGFFTACSFFLVFLVYEMKEFLARNGAG